MSGMAVPQAGSLKTDHSALLEEGGSPVITGVSDYQLP